MKLSIIMVNYNTKTITEQAIQSILSNLTFSDYDIWLVDNASTDGSQDYLSKAFLNNPSIHFVYNETNLGFSKANNIAIKQCTGEYILLLNSDTLVHPNAIESCLEYIQKESNIGALGCKLILGNGKLDHTCKRGFPTPEASLFYFLKLDRFFPDSKRFGAYRQSFLPDDTVNEVDAIVGAFMLLPRKVISTVGLLDEDFFMYGEDLDWCYRIKQAGYKIIYYPKAVVTHLKGQSSKKKRTKILYEFHRAMILFYKKHYKSQYSFITTGLVYFGIGLRLCLAMIINLFKK